MLDDSVDQIYLSQCLSTSQLFFKPKMNASVLSENIC